MEPRYIVRSELSLRDTKVLTMAIYKRQIILLIVLAVVELAAGIWLQDTLVYVCAAAMAVFAFIYAFIVPRTMLRSAKSGHAGETTLTFYDDKFHADSNVENSDMMYSVFVKLEETDTHCLLYVRRRTAMVFGKDKIIQGDPTAFMAFMQEKTGLPVKHK